MLCMEIQRGKEGMADMPFVKDMIKTAACTARLMKASKVTYDAGIPPESEFYENESLDLLNDNNNCETKNPNQKMDTFYGDA